MGIMQLMNDVAGHADDEDDLTWDEAVAVFEAAQPVDLVRSHRQILVIIRYADDRFTATSPELTGFEVSGPTLAETRRLAREAVTAYVDPAVEILECLPQSPTGTAGASRVFICDHASVFRTSSQSGSGTAFVSSHRPRRMPA
jgi:predicted RNase H-like HicB family nuclease